MFQKVLLKSPMSSDILPGRGIKLPLINLHDPISKYIQQIKKIHEFQKCNKQPNMMTRAADEHICARQSKLMERDRQKEGKETKRVGLSVEAAVFET